MWSELEHLLHHGLVMALLGHFAKDGRAISVFAHMAFPQKMDVMSAMLGSTTNTASILLDYRQTVQPLLKRAQEKRNAVLHQRWSVNEGSVHRIDIKARGEFRMTIFSVTLDELKATTSLIEEASEKLLLLVVKPLAPNDAPQQGQ
jgi:hypothetical protein